jgi:selT/selW/selH-like putative selenoprotein
LAEEINLKFKDVTVDLIEGSGGVFDISKNGENIFSRTREGRFPEVDEILEKLQE